MHKFVAHFHDILVFFSWVPFIQMHMGINMSLNILIGTLIYTKNFIMMFIMKINVWLFIDKKTHLLIRKSKKDGLLKSKNRD